ncbi:WYL domain-containing protein [Corynebacterium sp. CCM 8835]|uniref:WYL domain-containing protein n=1 Tax=Corynebacterium antarcticum TaxID=2800405 RepID=A0A9Q4CA86_9CORY|nr:WYL domain-containing protein [Corynebacterium antarcticum]MCK7641387.1 WYL domain-containing protein [Corynebacterium antarcticum]MCK7660511.1 WYL domain-containing protein [Corynebacterium antarcticum]MCL0244618.1 WYL domain-containing protein [Corynebacterium antarcticum]MCX7490988.1 WYL domain-containing protein [Corynebacterium antarcticum]MCX7537014.1 WYL domain-containing protein [Corynebacterium antarcticum]
MSRRDNRPGGGNRLGDLVRMLNLLPYFEAHPGRSIMEAAGDLGYAPQQIMDDLNRLWCCGLPGMGPGDLVDLDHSYPSVRVTNSQGMDRPLRLTPTEAGALLLALESLENVGGLTDRDAVVSAAAKLRSIVPDSTAAVVDSVVTDSFRSATSPVLETIREALDNRTILNFGYYSAASDTTTRRRAVPARVFTREGNTYLSAWDTSAGKHRTFRVDRMDGVSATGETGDPRLGELNFDSEDPFSFTAVSCHADVRIRGDAVWLADYVPLKLDPEVEPVDGFHPARMPVSSRDWFVRFILGQGGRVLVDGPAELVAEVSERALAGLAAYHR